MGARVAAALALWAALGLLALGEAGAKTGAKPPLDFIERVTAGADPAQPLPMVIAVHGLGDRPDRFVALFESLPMPVRLIVPAAPTAYGRGFSWFPLRKAGDAARNAGLRSSADTLATLARVLAKSRPTVGKPVITGFSQGGMLSFAVAIHHPDAIAGAVPIAGALPRALWGEGPVPPIIAVHGEADRVVRFAEGEALAEALTERGAVRFVPIPNVAHRVPPPARRAVFDALAELLPAPRPRAPSKPVVPRP